MPGPSERTPREGASVFGPTQGETRPVQSLSGAIRGEEELEGSKNDEVGAYIEACPPRHRKAVTVLRGLVHESAPDAAETIRYKMPSFERPGGFVCSMASRKSYVSLYLGPSAVEEHREELGALDAGRGCVRFKDLEDLPLRTIGRILEGSGTP